jgi:hypothetical protein
MISSTRAASSEAILHVEVLSERHLRMPQLIGDLPGAHPASSSKVAAVLRNTCEVTHR